MFIHFLIFLFFLLFADLLAAEKICLKTIDGEVVYTNLCENFTKKIPQKKSKVNLTKFESNSGIGYSRLELERIVEEKCKLYGVDAKLIKEMIRMESGWNVNAISPKGAMGIMQLMPATAILMGVKNPFDPQENIDGGIRYMKYLLDRFGGDISLALAAYNAGPNLVASVGRIPNIPETRNYVNIISLRYYGKNQPSTPYVRSVPIKAVVMSDGTVLYTNREDMYIWSRRW